MQNNSQTSLTALLSSRDSRRVLVLAVPIILSNIAVPLVGIVDTAVMGRMAEPRYLAAVAIGAIIFSSVFWLFGFLKMGTGGLVAQALGSASAGSNDDEINCTVLRALCIAATIGVLLVLFRQPMGQLAMLAFDINDDVKKLALEYYDIRILAAPATLMIYCILGAFIGLQKMRSVLILQLILNVGNIVLTIIFFRYFDGGIAGVALASVIAEYLSLAYGLSKLQQINPLWPLAVPLAKVLDAGALRRLFVINANLFVRTLCLTFSFYWLTRSGGQLGELTLAANSILIHMVHFSAHALDGFAHAAETLCGNAYGKARAMLATSANKTGDQLAGEYGVSSDMEFRKAVLLTAFWGCIFAVLFVAFYMICGPWIINMMTTQEAVRDHANLWLWWIIVSPLVGVASFLLDGIYIGVTHTRDMRNAMLQSAIIFLAANLLLVQLFGNHGLWMSYMVLMLARALTLYRTYPRIIHAMKPVA